MKKTPGKKRITLACELSALTLALAAMAPLPAAMAGVGLVGESQGQTNPCAPTRPAKTAPVNPCAPRKTAPANPCAPQKAPPANPCAPRKAAPANPCAPRKAAPANPCAPQKAAPVNPCAPTAAQTKAAKAKAAKDETD